MTGTLINRQWRYLKWFLIGALIISSFSIFSMNSWMNIVTRQMWSFGPAPSSWSGGNTLRQAFGSVSSFYVPFALGLSALLALWQQYDALNRRNAMLMASLPAKRDTALVAQLLPAICIFALMALTMGIGLHICRLRHDDLLTLLAKISPYPALDAARNSPLVIWISMLRLFLYCVNVYLLMMVVLGLFGHIFAGIIYLCGCGLLLFFCAHLQGSYANTLEALFPDIRAHFSLREVFANLFWVVPDYDMFRWDVQAEMRIAYDVWQGFGAMLIVNVAIATGLFGLARWERRRVANEDLGNIFLFDLSRWAVILLPLGFLVAWAMIDLVHYSMAQEKMIYNVYFPIWIVAIALIAFIGWYLLIKRRRIRISRNAMAAVVVMMLISMPAVANAEDYVAPQFDSARIEFDAEHAQFMKTLSSAMETVPGPQPSEITGFDDDYYGYPGWDFNDPAPLSPTSDLLTDFGLDYAKMLRYADTFNDNDQYSFRIPRGELPEQQRFCDAMRAAGLQAMLDQYLARTADEGYIYSGPVRMYYFDLGNGWMQISIGSNIPLRLRDVKVFDETLLAGSNVRRKMVFSNGSYDTASYGWVELIDSGRVDLSANKAVTMNAHAQLNAIFDQQKIDRLMLNLYHGLPNREVILRSVMDAAVAQGAMTTADADAICAEITERIGANGKSSGALNGVRWTVDQIHMAGMPEIWIELRFD